MGSKYREVPLKVEYHQNSYDHPVNCVIDLESAGKLQDGELTEVSKVNNNRFLHNKVYVCRRRVEVGAEEWSSPAPLAPGKRVPSARAGLFFG